MLDILNTGLALPHVMHLASTGIQRINSGGTSTTSSGGTILTPVSGSSITSATLTGTSSLQLGIDKICNVVAGVGAGAGVLGIIAGGLMHTQVFHNERAPETGKHIIKNSLYGIGFMAGGPMLLKMALAL